VLRLGVSFKAFVIAFLDAQAEIKSPATVGLSGRANRPGGSQLLQSVSRRFKAA
jgi:hypothetical protein